MKKEAGQGVVESIFSVGLLGLILTGVVVLVVMTMSTKKSSYDRKKAVELGEIVMEETISQYRNDPEVFWQLTNIDKAEKTNFEGYLYSVNYQAVEGGSYPQCSIAQRNCVEVEVRIDWEGKENQTVFFNRFFSKN